MIHYQIHIFQNSWRHKVFAEENEFKSVIAKRDIIYSNNIFNLHLFKRTLLFLAFEGTRILLLSCLIFIFIVFVVIRDNESVYNRIY